MNRLTLRAHSLVLMLLFLAMIGMLMVPAKSFAISGEPDEVTLHVRGTPDLYPPSTDPTDKWKEIATIKTDMGKTFGDIKSELPAPLKFDGQIFLGYHKSHGSFPWLDSDQFQRSSYFVDYPYQKRFIEEYDLQGATNANDPAFSPFTQEDYSGPGAQPKVTPFKTYTEPMRDNAQFLGWFEDPDGKRPYDFTKRLNDYWEAQGKKYRDNYPNKHFPDHPYKVYEPIVTYAVFNEAPLLSVKDASITVGQSFDPLSMVVSARDKEDGDLKAENQVTFSKTYDPHKEGVYTIEFVATDTKGLKHRVNATLTVTKPEPPTPSEPEPTPAPPSHPQNPVPNNPIPSPAIPTEPDHSLQTPDNHVIPSWTPGGNLEIQPSDPYLYVGSGNIEENCDQATSFAKTKAKESYYRGHLPKTADENGFYGGILGVTLLASLFLLSKGIIAIRRETD